MIGLLGIVLSLASLAFAVFPIAAAMFRVIALGTVVGGF